SAFDGEPFAWIMSSVLFLPEILLLGLLWVVGRVLALDVNAVLLLNAVINLVALYGAIRFAAGRRREGSASIGWSIAALSVFCLLAVPETSPSRDALALASLVTTATCSSATVIAGVRGVAVTRRAFGHADTSRVLLVMLAVVASVSTPSIPLCAAWATVP